ncbi:hypothetical protein [Lysobacter auxotrophicus]|uniref:Uncharacterized protein n=1 Tax=Lysobacter auxotrophicus TaxID=2992573 RepID=A0ABN6UQ27_9GAMM|nr:hypothetical protein [Lysobacter auxotrophicus]BDU18057.1 hypothetical protein LA521A_32580 [Lysobacter auxotrophicus]
MRFAYPGYKSGSRSRERQPHKLTRLLEQLRNAETALGSDVMVTAREGYAVLKAVGKGDGLEALKKLLAKRFASGPREPAAKVPAV